MLRSGGGRGWAEQRKWLGGLIGPEEPRAAGHLAPGASPVALSLQALCEARAASGAQLKSQQRAIPGPA